MWDANPRVLRSDQEMIEKKIFNILKEIDNGKKCAAAIGDYNVPKKKKHYTLG